jgi:DNA polymerase-3 subunit delta
MIIFLYGRDSYRLKQNLDKIATEYRKKNSGMSFSILDFSPDAQGGTKQQLGKLNDLIKTVSFFGEKRLIVLKSAFSAGEEIADLITNWKLDDDKERILVFTENSEEKELAKKDKKLFNLLSAKFNIAKSFEPLEGKQLENWVKKEIEALGGKIEPVALRKLISYAINPVSRDKLSDPTATWRLKQEIDKLVNYKSAGGNGSRAKDEVINVSDIELLVGPNVNLNIFEVIDAIAGKNRYRALTMLYNHLESGADPYYIFSMVIFQFRNLLRVKTLIKNVVPYANIVKKTGLNPYVVKKTYEQCKKFDPDELKRAFAMLAQTEVSAKSGVTDMVEGLYRFALFLSA